MTEFSHGDRVCLREKNGRPYRTGTLIKDETVPPGAKHGVMWDVVDGRTEWTWPDEWARLDHLSADEEAATR